MVWLGFIAVYAGMGAASPPPLASSPVPPAASPASADGAEATGERRLAQRLEVVDAAMSRIVDLRADFEQRRHTPLLKKPVVSKGVVRTKGDLVRWDTATPRPSSLIIGRGLIQMYYPADKLVEIYPLEEGFKDLAGAPLPRLSVLRSRFDIAQVAAEDLGPGSESETSLALRLTPKNEGLRKHVACVMVLIDTSLPAATKVVIIDPEGERTDIVFRNVRLNSGVRDDEVQFAVPEGVRVSRPMGNDERAADQREKAQASAPPKGRPGEGRP